MKASLPPKAFVKVFISPSPPGDRLSDIPSGASSAGSDGGRFPSLHLHSCYCRSNMHFSHMYFGFPSLWVCLFMLDIHSGNRLLPFVCFLRVSHLSTTSYPFEHCRGLIVVVIPLFSNVTCTLVFSQSVSTIFMELATPSFLLVRLVLVVIFYFLCVYLKRHVQLWITSPKNTPEHLWNT